MQENPTNIYIGWKGRRKSFLASIDTLMIFLDPVLVRKPSFKHTLCVITTNTHFWRFFSVIKNYLKINNQQDTETWIRNPEQMVEYNINMYIRVKVPKQGFHISIYMYMFFLHRI